MNRLIYLINRAEKAIQDFKVTSNSVNELEVTTNMMKKIKEGATQNDLDYFETLICKVEHLIIRIKQEEA